MHEKVSVSQAREKRENSESYFVLLLFQIMKEIATAALRT